MDAIEALIKEIAEKSRLYVIDYVAKSDAFLKLSDSVKKIVSDMCIATLTSYLLLQVINKFQKIDFLRSSCGLF